MRIKAKMLLPRPELDEEGNEIDPREDLVRHLLEYKRFKEASKQFLAWEEQWMHHEKRGNIQKEIQNISSRGNVEAELQDVDLYKLLMVYKKVLDRYAQEQNKPMHEVEQFPYTIGEQIDFVLHQLAFRGGRMAFIDLIDEMPGKIAIIFNFLAILDLLQQRKITLLLGKGFNNFWIEDLIEEIKVEA